MMQASDAVEKTLIDKNSDSKFDFCIRVYGIEATLPIQNTHIVLIRY